MFDQLMRVMGLQKLQWHKLSVSCKTQTDIVSFDPSQIKKWCVLGSIVLATASYSMITPWSSTNV